VKTEFDEHRRSLHVRGVRHDVQVAFLVSSS
jgi:hypothetical protein